MNKNHVFILILVAIFIGIFSGTIIGYFYGLPSVDELKEIKPSLSTKIYDKNGELIGQLFVEQRIWVPLSKIPKIMQDAIIVTEDEQFYHHIGINIKGIIRAMLKNILKMNIIEGGSSITQQLARDLFLTKRKNITRKIKEMILALKIEKKYTKKEILEMYLNRIYFGCGAYGIEAASRIYFGKHVSDLTISECALLAGIPKSPNEFSPLKNYTKAIKRRNLILERLYRRKIISESEFNVAKNEQITLSRIEQKQAPYFIEYIRQQLEEKYEPNIIYKGGLEVYTTLDLSIQRRVQDVFDKYMVEAEKKLTKNKRLQGAVLAIDPKTGFIISMIGGRDFKESEFNRAVQAKRQPGSAFKPFIYLAAIDSGFTPATIIIDSPVTFEDRYGNEWSPQNYERKFYGPNTLRDALAHSRNVSTVRLLMKVGIDPVISYAHRLGIRSELRREYSLALGVSEVSLFELVSSFGVFANYGIRVEPISIVKIKDSEGRVLEEAKPRFEEVLKPEVAYMMTNLLSSVVEQGTARNIRVLGFNKPCAGKTGTTEDNTDVWFIGFTPEIVLGVWIGYDEKISLGHRVSAATLAVPLWTEIMKSIYKDKECDDFVIPPKIVKVKIDTKSGLLATKDCPPEDVKEEIFIEGTAPTSYCNIHRKKILF
jgi:penicillin-binding protein 1A